MTSLAAVMRALPIALIALRTLPPCAALVVASGGLVPVSAAVPLAFVSALPTLATVFDVPPLAPVGDVAATLLAEAAYGLALAALVALPFFAVRYGARVLDALRTRPGPRSSDMERVASAAFLLTFLLAGGLRALIRIVAAPHTAVPHPNLSDVAARATAAALGGATQLFGAAWVAVLAAETAVALAARTSRPVAAVRDAVSIRSLAALGAVALTVGWFTGAAGELTRTAFDAARALRP